MKLPTAAIALCCLLALAASGHVVVAAPSRALKGIQATQVGEPATTAVEPKAISDYLQAAWDEWKGNCVYGSCCGSHCDCDAGSDAADPLDSACREHDTCYEGSTSSSDCEYVCRCDPDLASRAEEIGNTDCSAEEDPEACEEMVSKTGVIANSMKAKALYCEC